MNRADVLEAFGLLDDDLINETREKRDAVNQAKGIHALKRLGIAPLAACLALVIGTITVCAAIKLTGILKVQEGTPYSENDVVYQFQIDENFKKVPMSKITGKAARYLENYKKNPGAASDPAIKSHKVLNELMQKLSFDSVKDAAGFIGYNNLNLAPLESAGDKVFVILSTEDEKKLKLCGVEIVTGNIVDEEKVYGPCVMSQAFLYTENSSFTPGLTGGVLSRDVESDDYDLEAEMALSDLKYSGSFLIIKDGENAEIQTDVVIENDREFQVVTASTTTPVPRKFNENMEPIEYASRTSYQKSIICLEDGVIYLLTAVFDEEESDEVEEIIRKWMGSF